MAALPRHPRTIISADGIGGRIVRVDTVGNSVTVAFEHAALGPGDAKDATARGVEGLKIRGNYLYFTNSAQRTFGRFPIDVNGTNTGDVEILARLDGTPEGGVSYGDFSFDKQGNAFVAVHPWSVHKITPKGVQSAFVGGKDTVFLEPTSVVVSNNGGSIYVSTAGKDTGYALTGETHVKTGEGPAGKSMDLEATENTLTKGKTAEVKTAESDAKAASRKRLPFDPAKIKAAVTKAKGASH
ncbi:hypothetical protein NUW58_g10658 [Xylaria curta]|uniref:Uncharacterized protein n=1 Tax=Xylaria curta TaxID=42375 RepID=A0ACC1MHI0_9PEZI|nr:hypothetical protein NUW58_g10658 [Xylaria curta]